LAAQLPPAADIFDRAVPRPRLILKQRRLPATLNVDVLSRLTFAVAAGLVYVDHRNGGKKFLERDKEIPEKLFKALSETQSILRCIGMKAFATIVVVALLLAANGAQGQGDGGPVKQGQEIFENNCADCHRTSGEGLPAKFPALKGSAYVTGDPQPVLATVLHGRRGKLGHMPAWGEKLNDQEIAAVVSYIRNAWGNKASAVKPEDVAAARKK
jgi:cytochrome c6